MQNLMPRPAIDTPIAGRGIRYTPQNTSLCPSVGIRGRLQCSRHTQATWTDSDRRTNRLVQKLPFRKITPSKNYPFKNYPFKKITPSKKLPFKNYLFKKLPFKNYPFKKTTPSKITPSKITSPENYPFKKTTAETYLGTSIFFKISSSTSRVVYPSISRSGVRITRWLSTGNDT